MLSVCLKYTDVGWASVSVTRSVLWWASCSQRNHHQPGEPCRYKESHILAVTSDILSWQHNKKDKWDQLFPLWLSLVMNPLHAHNKKSFKEENKGRNTTKLEGRTSQYTLTTLGKKTFHCVGKQFYFLTYNKFSQTRKVWILSKSRKI